jgi:hypothetical protein
MDKYLVVLMVRSFLQERFQTTMETIPFFFANK